MFDFVRKHTRLLQLLLLILILPSFVVFGIQGYSKFSGDEGIVAKVGKQAITQAEWEQVWNFPPQLYLPLFEFARINRIPMIALNVDQKLTRAIADKGWQGVPAAEREGVGRPAAALPAYRDLLRELHRSHLAGRRQAGKGDNSFEIDAGIAADFGHLGSRFWIVTVFDRTRQAVTRTGGKKCFSQMWRQRHDAPGRLT